VRWTRPDQNLSAGCRFVLAATLLLLFFTSACTRQSTDVARFFVFGTLVEVKLYGAESHQSDEAFASLQSDFQKMHRDWHAWEPGALTTINRKFRNHQTAEADAAIIEMVRQSQQLEKLTGGRFNPAIGQLIELWGFHTSDYPIEGPPPTQTAIAELLGGSPSTADITIVDESLSTHNPSVQLDFGGLAKGFAVDLAVARLKSIGITDAIVNAGGDLRAFGQHGDRPWAIAVENPLGGVLGSIEVLGDEAVFTSGNYQRFRQATSGERYPHILDPRTGWPVKDVLSATVISDNGLVADAAATALVVAGIAEWHEVAGPLGLTCVLLTLEDGSVYVTAEMEQRMTFTQGTKPALLN